MGTCGVEMKRMQTGDVFAVRANVGMVVPGPMESLPVFMEGAERLCSGLGLVLVFERASASRLRNKDDVPEAGP